MIGYVFLHPIKKGVPYLLAIFSTDANSTFVTINARVTLDVAEPRFPASRGLSRRGRERETSASRENPAGNPGNTSPCCYGHFFWPPGKTAIHFLV